MKPGLPRQLSWQRGATLLTGLIFLVVLTMIGITAARMSGLEERMSGNLRDRSIAMQAAELALRDAERDIRDSGRISGLTNFVANCTNGLCYNGVAGYAVNPPVGFSNPVWNTPAIMTAAPSVAYGGITLAGNIAGLSAQPRYLIEGIRRTPPGGGTTYYYRITVRAQGINPNTVVWLQEVFRP
jgi:type IV pilus assembly protein PilX